MEKSLSVRRLWPCVHLKTTVSRWTLVKKQSGFEIEFELCESFITKYQYYKKYQGLQKNKPFKDRPKNDPYRLIVDALGEWTMNPLPWLSAPATGLGWGWPWSPCSFMLRTCECCSQGWGWGGHHWPSGNLNAFQSWPCFLLPQIPLIPGKQYPQASQ